MHITDVRIRLFSQKEDRLRAVASITLDGCFVVHDIKLVEREQGGFLVLMPARVCEDGERRDTAHPINRETRKMIEDAVISRYREQKKRSE